jgi:mono/diheme cytochrome c family protein
MNKLSLVRPAAAFIATLALGACGGSGSTPATTAPTPAAAAPAASSGMGNMSMGGSSMPAGVTMAMIAEGDSIFHKGACARCHGADAKGTARAPNLTAGTWMHGSGSYNDIVKVVTNGVPVSEIKDPAHTVAMRGRAGNPPLTDDQVRAVSAYVYSISHH